MRSRLLALVALTHLACGGVRIPPPATIFPLATSWTATFDGERIEGDLATDGTRVFVATREGAVRALDPLTGSVLWKVSGRPGRLSAAQALLVLRSADGTIERLDPETGLTLWRRDSRIGGPWPATLTDTHVVVGGRGLACLRLADGGFAWTADGVGEASAPPVVLVGIYDTNPIAANELAGMYDTPVCQTVDALLEQVDAVSIATPTPTHFDLIQRCLEHNVHVLVEKPITDYIENAEQLARMVDGSRLIIQVGHIERFNPTYLEEKGFRRFACFGDQLSPAQPLSSQQHRC